MYSLILFLIVLVFIVWVLLSGLQAEKQFKLEYSEFLLKNEGIEIFCYTSREKFQSIIESKIIPNLDESISIIKLEGKEPNTDLD